MCNIERETLRMKKYLVLCIAVSFFLTGCTGLKTVGKGVAMAGVVGLAATSAYYEEQQQSIDDYVRTNGAPSAQYTTSDGDTVYSFVRACPNSQGSEHKIVTVGSNHKIKTITTAQQCR